MIKLTKLAAATIALSASTLSYADAFAPNNARSFAMGGAGTAAATNANAMTFNPALLAAQAQSDTFQLDLLTIGGLQQDFTDTADEVDDLSKSLDQLDSDIAAVTLPTLAGTSITCTASSCSPVAASTNTVANSLESLGNKNVIGSLGGGLGLSFPSSTFAMGLSVQTTFSVGLTPDVSSTDLNELRTFANILQDDVITLAEAGTSSLISVSGTTVTFNPTSAVLTSKGSILAAAITDVGLTVAKQFDWQDSKISVGIMPKIQQVDTFSYETDVNNFDSGALDNDANRTDDSGINLDAGVIYQPNEAPWSVGASLKDIIAQSYTTTRGESIDIDAKLRVGGKYAMGRTILAADLDITENAGIGIGNDTQFLALGAEFDAFAKLRVGYRANLADSLTGDVLTAGIGLGIVDFSVFSGEDDQSGAMLRLGFNL